MIKMEEIALLSAEDRMRLQTIDESKVTFEPSSQSTDIKNVPASLHFASFENAKKELQIFSNKSTSDFGLESVPSSGGLFGLGDHKVTGDELNNLTTHIQDYLKKINGVNLDLIREFGQVYTALESLDREYIPAILSAVKGAEIASEQAKAAGKHAHVAQEDIRKTVKEQKNIIEVLKKHKDKLDKLKHLSNIDEIWENIESILQDIEKWQGQANEFGEQLKSIYGKINILQECVNEIKASEHLHDIDTTWDTVNSHDKTIRELQRKIMSYEEFRGKLEKQSNLFNIDNLNKELEKNVADIKETKREILDIQTELYELKNIGQKWHEENNSVIEELKRQIHIAYVVAGGAIGIGIIEFLLSIMRII